MWNGWDQLETHLKSKGKKECLAGNGSSKERMYEKKKKERMYGV